jgi:tetratricopeptide (TPR) repeat protein
LFALAALLAFGAAWAQPKGYRLLQDEHRLGIARKVMKKMYNWEFQEAEALIAQLGKGIEGHPVEPFAKAMLLYWKHVPIDFTAETHKRHVALLEEASAAADRILEEDEKDLEGIFFKMASRSLLMKHLADEGESMKAASEAKGVYRLIKEGFDLKDEFVEFYFTTGLYNYYREYYPERYPAYKPIAFFFHSGDKEEGLEQLVFTARNAVFTSAEAYSYLTYIYLRYEQDHQHAVRYIQELVKLYPRNLYFAVMHAEVLFLSKRYGEARAVAERIKAQAPDSYYRAVAALLSGMLLDQEGKHDGALAQYKQAESLSKTMRYRFYEQKVYLYYGLSGAYARKGQHEQAKHYYKLAKEYDANGYLKTVPKPKGL